MISYALDQISAQIPDALIERYVDRSGDQWGVVSPNQMAAVARLAKEKLGFRLFVSMDAVDRLHLSPEEQNPRFEVLYFLRNLERGEQLRLKVRVNEGESIPTIQNIFQGANWGERFVWAFYGVRIEGGEQRRMLMYEDFQGHALRKDYPLRGRQPLTSELPLLDEMRGPGTSNVTE